LLEEQLKRWQATMATMEAQAQAEASREINSSLHREVREAACQRQMQNHRLQLSQPPPQPHPPGEEKRNDRHLTKTRTNCKMQLVLHQVETMLEEHLLNQMLLNQVHNSNSPLMPKVVKLRLKVWRMTLPKSSQLPLLL